MSASQKAIKGLAQYPSLKGKRIFITGGGTGIGEALVSAFAEQGALVAFVDIATEASEALCARLAAAGFPAPLFRHCDIRDIGLLQATMAAMAKEIGDFDVLVNNAANDTRHAVEDVSVEFWDNSIAINQRPLFFTCQAVLAGMKKKGGGSIINFSSISWHIANGGYPAYVTAKSAVIGLTRGLARELGPHNIRVNTVTPGWVITERQNN
ncbi:SDR family NAD(P)-dependent oxidoreductase, partial [Glaciimonas sp. CA11.2]